MYYRSMRHSFFQLARKYGAAYLQLNIVAPLEIALKNNNNRPISSKVSEEIIRHMEARFEAPNPHLGWEKHSLTISTDCSMGDLRGRIPWEELGILWRDPISITSEEDTVTKEANRIANLTNLLHQLDIISRKAVGELIKMNGKNSSKESVNRLGQVRKQFLTDIKESKYREIVDGEPFETALDLLKEIFFSHYTRLVLLPMK